MDSDTSRRQLLAYSSLSILGLGGCVGGSDDDTEDGGDDDAEANDSGEDEDENEDATEDAAQSDDGESENEDEDDHEGDHSHDHSTDHEVGDPETTVEVEMVADDGFHFVPHVVHVEEGGTVEWVVESGSHDTTTYHPDTYGNQQRIPDEADPWESGLMSDESDPFTRTFDVEGVYDYVCTPHEGEGMIGTVVVGWPDPDTQPGLQSPDENYPDSAIEQLERFNEQIREVLETSGDDESDETDENEQDDHHDESDEDDHDDHDHDH